MTVRDLLNILFKRKLVILVFFAAALGGGFVGLKFVSPTYEATGRLLLRIGQEDMYMPVLPNSQARMPVMNLVREEQLHSESNILTDPHLARLVVAELTPQVLFPGIDIVHPWYTPKGMLQALAQAYRAVEDYFAPLSSNRTLEDRAVSAFERAFKAEAVKSSNFIEVSMRNKSPQAAALGVNTLIKHYIDERVRIYQREQSSFFTQQLGRIDAQLKITEFKLASFREEGQVLDLDRQRSAQVDNLNDVRKRIDENRVALGQAERRVEVLKTQLSSVSATTQLSGAQASNNLATSELGKQIAEVQRRELEIERYYKPYDPRLASLREERQLLERMLAEQSRPRDVSAQQGINPLHSRIRDDLLQAEAALAGLRQSAGNLPALEREVVDRLGRFNRQDADNQELLQQLKVLRDTRQLYIERTEEARLATEQSAARIGNVSIVSLAEPPTKPVSPKLWLVLLGVLAGGLLGSIGLAFLLEFLDDTLSSDADVRRHLQLPLLARVPYLTH